MKAPAKNRIRRFWAACFLPLVYAVLLYFLFGTVQQAGRADAQISLRYEEAPLSGLQVASAMRAVEQAQVPPAYTAAYWRLEKAQQLQTLKGQTQTRALYIDGDMQGVYPAQFVRGTYPAALDKEGVAVSEGLAFLLWGGANQVGTPLELHGRSYTVRGVFSGEEALLLVQTDAAQTPDVLFTGVMLTGATSGSPRTAAQTFAQTAGLPEADVIVNETGITAVIQALAWLPFGVLAAWFCVRLVWAVRRLSYIYRQLVWLVLLFAVALLIPKALEALPGWAVPAQWSDMAHWGRLLAQLRRWVNEYMMLTPTLKDVQMRWLLVRQMVLVVPALLCAVGCIVQVEGRIRNAKNIPRPLQSADNTVFSNHPHTLSQE